MMHKSRGPIAFDIGAKLKKMLKNKDSIVRCQNFSNQIKE
jgi:hypothetical protein